MKTWADKYQRRVEPTKRCTRCRTPQPLAEFHADRTRGDGLDPTCRTCRRVHRKRRGDTTRELRQSRAYNRATRALRERHRHEFDVLYAEQRRREGL